MKATVTDFLNGKKVSLWKISSFIFLWAIACGLAPFSNARAATVSGEVICADFETGFGDIYVYAFDGVDTDSSNVVGTAVLSAPGAYTTTDISGFDEVWIYSFWDANDNVLGSPYDPYPDSADYTGESSANPISLSSGDAAGVSVELLAPEAGPSVSGTITCDLCPTEGALLVGVFDAAYPDDDVDIAVSMFTSPGAYTVTNIPSDGTVLVRAVWDENANYEYDPNEWSGEYSGTVDLSGGGDVVGIDFELQEGATPVVASIEGYITCMDCPTGDLYVEVYDIDYPGPPVASEMLLTPGSYSLTDVTAYGDVTVLAFVDENGNTTRDPEEYYGMYPTAIDLSLGDSSAVDFDVFYGQTITGSIECYDCPVPGDLYVYAFDQASSYGPVSEYTFNYPGPLTVTEPIAYTLTNVHASGYVSVFAFWDENGNEKNDEDEFTGSYYEGIDISYGDVGYVDFELMQGGGGASISGYIECTDCPSYGELYVYAFDASDLTTPIAQTTLASPGDYSLTNITTSGMVAVYAFWDEDSNGTKDTGEMSGSYYSYVDLSYGDVYGIDFSLYAPFTDAVISGTIICEECVNAGDLYVGVFDASGTSIDPIAYTVVTDPDAYSPTGIITPYTVTGISGDSLVTVMAFWDENGNGEDDAGEIVGAYDGYIDLYAGDATGIDFMIPSATGDMDISVSGTITCDDCMPYSPISIVVFDGPDPETANLLGSAWTWGTDYSVYIYLTGASIGDTVYIWAYWDINDNGDYDMGDYVGAYAGDLTLLEGGLSGVDITLSPPEFGLLGTVTNFRNYDGTHYTLYDLWVAGFSGDLPEDVDTLTITGPSGELPYTIDNFYLDGNTGSLRLIVTESPEIGAYTFDFAGLTGTTEEKTGTATDTQSENLEIPVPDSSLFDPVDATHLTTTSPTFSWSLVELTGTQLYYRIIIENMSGERVFTSPFEFDMMSYTIYGADLNSGEGYRWQVQVADENDIEIIQNVTASNWLTFTAYGDLPDPIAAAGPDQTVTVSDTVTLNGSFSKPSSITYAWTMSTMPTGSTSVLTNAETASPSFVPDLTGTYELSLAVSTTEATSSPDTVSVTAVAAGTEEAAIVALNQSINAAFAAYIDDSTTENLDAVMTFFSDSFLDEGQDKAAMRTELEEFFPYLISFTSYLSDIVVDGSYASAMMTQIVFMYNEYGEEDYEFDKWEMYLVKEGDTWKIYGDQQLYDIWVETRTKTDGTYGVIFGLEDQAGAVTSITVSGPGIDTTLTLYDDGLHNDDQEGDGYWGNYINTSTLPTAADTYTFTVNGTDTLEESVSGVMTGVATNGAVSETYPRIFSWDSAEGAMFYAIELYDSTGSYIWSEWDIPIPYVEYTGQTLFVGQTYQWRVRSYDENENFSDSAYFTFVPTTGQEGGDKSIAGTVYESDGVTPIAYVWVNAWSESMISGYSAMTDESGQYTILNLTSASDYKVDIWSEDYAYQYYKMADTCSLPAAVSDTVNYADCGINPVGTSDWSEATNVDLSSYNASGVNFLLSVGVTISGTVRDGDGNPVGDVWISAWSESTGGGSGEYTETDGTYVLKGLTEGTDYRVEIWDDVYANQFYMYDGYISGDPAPVDNDYSSLTPVGTTLYENATLVSTSESASALGVDFVVSEGKSISGTVLADGAPVANAWVNAWSDSQSTGKGIETDQYGEYTITGLMPASDYKVDIWHESYTYQIYNNKTDWSLADLVDITTDNAVDINFNLSAGNSISGRVTNANGDGLANIWVNAYSDNSMFGGGESTDLDGYYTISGLAPAADYRVDVWTDGYIGQYYNGQTDWSSADLVDVSAGSVTDINFVLSAGVSISGTITLPTGDTDFSSIWVNVWSETAQFGSGESIKSANISGNTATYTISNLPSAADYKVDVWSENYATQYYDNKTDWSLADLVDVTGGSRSGIDFTLSAGTYIEGTVTLPTGYTSYDEIWVNAYSDSGGYGGGTDVNSDGTYRISGLTPASDYKVEIYSDTFQDQYYNGKTDWTNADLVDVSAGSISGIDFTLSTGAVISGTVTDSSGTPLAGIWVEAWSESGAWGGTETDAGGNFSINGLTDGTEYHVNIYHDEYANQVIDVTTGTTEAGSVAFTLNAGVGISGTVTDSDGNPVAYAWVNAWSDTNGSGMGESTDAYGQYSISGLAAASDYRVDVWKDGYAGQFYNNKSFWDDADLVDLTSGSATGIDFVISTGNTISGTITIPTGGSTDVWVNAYSDTAGGMGVSVDTWVGDDGSFTIDGLVPAADYKIDVWSEDYLHVYYLEGTPAGTGDWSSATSVDITTGDVSGIAITLSTGNTISGTVTVPSGGSLSNLWVNAGSDTAMSWNGGMVVTTGTPNVGAYTITSLSPASDYRVDIWSEDYGYQVYDGKKNWDNATLVDITSGNATGINFNLSAGNTISGRITDSSGNGIAYAWVSVWSDSSYFGIGESTDADGYYTIRGLDAVSDYVLEVWADEYGHAFYQDNPPNNTTYDWEQVTHLDLTTGSISDINVTLSAGTTISGTVTAGGSPVQYAWVSAWSSDGSGNGAETDASGNYTIKGLPASANYKVEVWASGYITMYYNNQTDYALADLVDTTGGNVTGIDFALTTGNTISGTVTAGGSPVGSVWVNAWSETSGSWGSAETATDGTYTITGLAPGTDFVVDVWSESYAHQFYNLKSDWMSADRVDIASGNASGIDFNLSDGNSISGTITLPSGNTNYYRVWVYAWSDATGSGNGASVKYDGTFTITGLAPGTGYRIEVSSDVYARVFYNESNSPDYTARRWENATQIDLTSADKTGVNMTLGAGLTITGTVDRDGTGVQGVWVDAYSSSMDLWSGAETDADGNYTIKGLLAAADYEVSTWSWNYVNAKQTGVSAGDTGVNLTLTDGFSISGTLQDSSGTGLGNVFVDAWSDALGVGGWTQTSSESGSEGNFTISGLQAGTYFVGAGTSAHGFVSTSVEITTTDVTGILLQFAAGDAITGTIIKAGDGMVITDTEVIVGAFDAGDNSFYNSTTASATDGSFTLNNLPTDMDFKIRVEATGYVTQYYSGQSDIGSANAVTPGTTGVNFSMTAE